MFQHYWKYSNIEEWTVHLINVQNFVRTIWIANTTNVSSDLGTHQGELVFFLHYSSMGNMDLFQAHDKRFGEYTIFKKNGFKIM